MALPRGVAKSDSGALFMLRSARELATWTDDDLKMRWRWISAQLNPETGGLDYVRSHVRRIALSERRAITSELVRRGRT